MCLLSCSSDDELMQAEDDQELTQEEEVQNLSELLAEIELLATSEACTGDSDVSFTAIGNKACGGPAGYIAYSLKIDTDSFLEQVEEYTEQQLAFNMKWGVISDCAVENPPSEVSCMNGVPRLGS